MLVNNEYECGLLCQSDGNCKQARSQRIDTTEHSLTLEQAQSSATVKNGALGFRRKGAADPGALLNMHNAAPTQFYSAIRRESVGKFAETDGDACWSDYLKTPEETYRILPRNKSDTDLVPIQGCLCSLRRKGPSGIPPASHTSRAFSNRIGAACADGEWTRHYLGTPGSDA